MNAQSIVSLIKHSFIKDAGKQSEVLKVFTNFCSIDSVMPRMLEMREQIIKVLPRRVEHFKDQRCKGATHIVHHWAFKAFEDNLMPLCRIVLLNRFLTKMVAGVSTRK